jgi:aspartyl-tRNA(Asn)/glutamyl-tRNA(Gln) amidotransferase subunit A
MNPYPTFPLPFDKLNVTQIHSSDELAFSDATALGQLIAKRRISSLELTRLYLARLEKYGASVGAVVTIMHDRALREARTADRELARGGARGPLHGVGYGAKDLLAAIGAPTTWGAQPYRHQVFNYDASVIKKLHAAGCVLLAKLAMVELAGGFGYNDADASFTGPGRTPWNRDYWSGGSSSGPGAAVAAGLVGFAIGSETNGSILNPSGFCGVTGLRPTYGRVSRHGAMALMWTSDKLGPICRSARDTEIVLKTIAGHDPGDATSFDAPFPAIRGRRPKIGVLKDGAIKSQPADVFTALLNGECAAAFRELIESGRSRELQSKDDRVGGYQQYGSLAVDYVDAMRQRKILNQRVDSAFAAFDAIVYPNSSTVALPIGVPFDKAYPEFPGGPDMGSAGNLAGLPAIGVPNGFGDHHLPTGLALMGRASGELTLTQIAKGYQARTSFHAVHPAV